MSENLFNDTRTAGRKPTDYKAVAFEYLLHWPVIVACLVAAMAAAYVYLRYQPPVYSVSSTVLIKQGEKMRSVSASQIGGMQDLGTFSMASNFDNEIEVLQSFSLIKKVVSRLSLYIDYTEERPFGYAIPVYNNTPVRVWMTPDEAERLPSPLAVTLACGQSGAVTATVSYAIRSEEHTLSKAFGRLPAVFVTPVGTLSLSAPPDSIAPKWQPGRTVVATVTSPSAMAASYKARLSAAPTSDYTSIVRLGFNDTDISRGEDFLTALVELYNNEANEDKNQVAIRTAEFIDERIRVINEELGTTESELAEYKQRAGLTDLDADAQLALQGNSEYDQKRADNTNQLRLVRYLSDYIDNPANKNEVIPVNVGLTDAALTNVITQYNELMVERKRLLRTSKETSPAVINLDVAIAATRSTVLTTVESAEKALLITRNNLDIEAGKYRTRISNAPRQERELRDISRQQEIKANLYLMLLQKREENAITLAAKANNGRVVEEPRVAGLVAPNSRNIYMMAFILGLLFPVGGIWLSRSLKFKIEGRKDVERMTNVPVVGDIPRADTAQGSIVIKENSNEVMEEVFRNLRTNVQYMMEEDGKVVLFTSSTSGEGKSFNAANLALSLAFMEKRTVIVGLDIRNPSLNRIFGIDSKADGITRYLASPASTDLLSLCRPVALSPFLSVLPCGTIPPNPTELVARKTLDKAVEQLRQHFDYIIIDTAPVGMVTDTRLIMRVADLCVYVCRADYTRKNDFEQVNDLAANDKVPPLCVLINGIDMDKRKNGYYYGYGRYAKYGKYGYGHKYGHGAGHYGK